MCDDDSKDEHSENTVSVIEKLQNNKTPWTYDTGTSEHITNKKEIHTNFKEEKISMKCANDSICEFDGIGTYEGSING